MRSLAPAAFARPCAVALAVLLFAAAALAQTAPTPVNSGAAARPAPAFHHVDADQSGHVSLDEVLAYARQQRETKPFALKDVDRDGDGIITQDELNKAGIKGLEGYGDIRARELDITGDGYVSHQDLDDYFASKHRAAYARADADKDGALKPSEFTLLTF